MQLKLTNKQFTDLFINSVGKVGSLLEHTMSVYKIVSGSEFPNMPAAFGEMEDMGNGVMKMTSSSATFTNDAFLALTIRSDIQNAIRSSNNYFEFLGKLLNKTKDEIIEIANQDEPKFFDSEYIVIEVNDEKSEFDSEMYYDCVLDSFTYWYDVTETLDKIYGINSYRSYQKYCKDFSDPYEILKRIVLEYRETNDLDSDNVMVIMQYLSYSGFMLHATRCLLGFFDTLYGLKYDLAFDNVGNYKTKYLPKIKNKYIHVSFTDEKDEKDEPEKTETKKYNDKVVLSKVDFIDTFILPILSMENCVKEFKRYNHNFDNVAFLTKMRILSCFEDYFGYELVFEEDSSRSAYNKYKNIVGDEYTFTVTSDKNAHELSDFYTLYDKFVNCIIEHIGAYYKVDFSKARENREDLDEYLLSQLKEYDNDARKVLMISADILYSYYNFFDTFNYFLVEGNYFTVDVK